jgi:hypothetical protein
LYASSYSGFFILTQTSDSCSFHQYNLCLLLSLASIPLIYDNAEPFSEGLARVEKDGKWGYIDKTGKEVVPIIYDVAYHFSEGLVQVEQDYKRGYTDKTGKVVVPLIYDIASDFSEGLATVYKDGKWGYVDKTGKEVIALQFDSAGSFSGGLAQVEKDGKYGIMSNPLTEASSAVAEKPSAWAAEQVHAAIVANLVPQDFQLGYTQATTRAEFAALIVALYEKTTGTEITKRTKFTDTTDSSVEKAAGIGVVSGVGDNNFSPNTELTREQAATMLSRLANVIGKPLTKQEVSFADKVSMSPWALEAVGQMQVTGIMGGVGDNTFAPKEPYTREQSIITIVRLYDAVK